MVAVALIGADGAGKTTVAREVVRRLGPSARYLYMGVNLDASALMLPSTRFALAIKRARGGKSDLQGFGTTLPVGRQRRSIAAGARTFLRMVNWLAEEWFRQIVSWWHERRGRIVIFDRHFFADYYASHIDPRSRRHTAWARLHGFVLARLYPRPDMVICLDAPAHVLWARKPEGDIQSRERRRQEYLRGARAFKVFFVVDGGRPLEDVASEVVDLIVAHAQKSPGQADGRDGRGAIATLDADMTERA